MIEKQHFPEEIIGERVILRRHAPQYTQEAFEVIKSNRDHFLPFMAFAYSEQTIEETKEFLESSFKEWNDFIRADYCIFLKETNQLIGSGGLHGLNWKHRHGIFGYWLAKDHTGNGYVQELIKLLEKEAFTIGFHRLVIEMDIRNKASEKTAKKAGYTHEGTLRDNLFEHGQFTTDLIYSKLQSEWDAEQKGSA